MTKLRYTAYFQVMFITLMSENIPKWIISAQRQINTWSCRKLRVYESPFSSHPGVQSSLEQLCVDERWSASGRWWKRLQSVFNLTLPDVWREWIVSTHSLTMALTLLIPPSSVSVQAQCFIQNLPVWSSSEETVSWKKLCSVSVKMKTFKNYRPFPLAPCIH